MDHNMDENILDEETKRPKIRERLDDVLSKDSEDDKKRKSFSKIMVLFLMAIAVLDMQLSYLLAFLGKDDIAETLSVALATEIVGVMLGYFAKAYFETKSKKINDLEKHKVDYYGIIDDSSYDFINEDDSVMDDEDDDEIRG